MSIRVKQHDISDCGAACLASVARHYKLEVPVSRIRQYAGTNSMGTNVAGMLEAAVRLGFDAKGVRGTSDSLFKIPLPAIAHIIINGRLQHYVVIYKITKQKIVYMDPAFGKLIRKRLIDFKDEWTGVLILLFPGNDFVRENQKTSLFRRFFMLLQPHRIILIQVLFGALIYTLLGLSMSIFVQKIVDFVLVDKNRSIDGCFYNSYRTDD
jgi:ATP-binding cassette, subfamily C, bacteriocin exporter